MALRSKAYACSRSPAQIVVSNSTGACPSVCCECCVLSGRGLWDELITRPEESYRLWCVVVSDLGTSWMRKPWPNGGLSCKKSNNKQRGKIALDSSEEADCKKCKGRINSIVTYMGKKGKACRFWLENLTEKTAWKTYLLNKRITLK